MTAREVVRKGDAPTSAPKVPAEEVRNVIRQIFRFPGPRSDSPFSDVTAAEPALDHKSPPLIPEKTDLPTVPEQENETVSFSASASLNSSHHPAAETPATAPIISMPIPPAPPTQNKQQQSKSHHSANKPETKAATVIPLKEDPKPKEEPHKSTPPQKQQNGPKPNIQEQVQPVVEEKSKLEAQDSKKKSFQSRLADAGKVTGSPTSAQDAVAPKDKDGDKSTDNKEAKGSKDTANTKDASGPLPTGQDPNETPHGTPFLNQDSEQPGTPTTGLGEENQSPFGPGRKRRKGKEGNQQFQQGQGQGQGNTSGKPPSPVNARSIMGLFG